MGSLPEIVGHQQVIERFAQWVRNDRLANTYLFTGPAGSGKRTVANWIAQGLLCQQSGPLELEPCGECPDCQQVAVATHPDLLIVEKPEDKNLVPVEQLIGTREKRMRAGLCHDIAMKPFRGGRRIAIIDDADFLNQEGANCLLKTLEEPPESAVIILIASSEHQQLPTIRSRSQIVRFQPLSSDEVLQILQREEWSSDVPRDEVALASEGSLKFAESLADPDVWAFRKDWLNQLASMDPGNNEFFEVINAFVDAGGKDGAAKRNRMRLIAEMATRFYRHLMVTLNGIDFSSDTAMSELVTLAAANWSAGPEAVADCVERCSAVRGQVAANANQALMIETLLSDLGRLSRKESLV